MTHHLVRSLGLAPWSYSNRPYVYTEIGSMSQAQPVRGGDVYPQSAADQEARRERDRVITQGHVKHDALHVDETDLP
ncbi:hypothetical protein EJB05_21090, partial [Eragrostis curvula]